LNSTLNFISQIGAGRRYFTVDKPTPHRSVTRLRDQAAE
jgi:hypothetical protein